LAPLLSIVTVSGSPFWAIDFSKYRAPQSYGGITYPESDREGKLE
jgi:hypothetical protein